MSLFREEWLKIMSKDYNISFIIPTYLINLIKKTKLLDTNLAIELDKLYKIINNFLLQISTTYNKYNIFLRVFILSTFFRLEKPKNVIKDLEKFKVKDIFNFDKNLICIVHPINKTRFIYNFDEIINNIFELFDNFEINTYFFKLNKILKYDDFLNVAKKELININFNDFEGNEIKNFIFNLITIYKNYEKDLKFLWSTIHKYIKEINNDYFEILYNFIDELKKINQQILMISTFSKTNENNSFFENSKKAIILQLIRKIYFIFEKFDFLKNNKEISNRKNLLIDEIKKSYKNLNSYFNKSGKNEIGIGLQNTKIQFSATGRIKSINFPFRNYIVAKNFDIFFNNVNDNEKIKLDGEDIPSSVIGSTVEYLTHFMMGEKIEDAFKVALDGIPYIIRDFKKGITDERIKKTLYEIKGLDDKSIEIACKIAALDCWRGGEIAILAFKPIKKVNNIATKNIRKMVKRSLKFWQKYGPIIKNSYTFDGGWTKLIPKGEAEGDFMTKDTLWDFKTSVEDPIKNNKYILQLIIYYIMGLHSNIPEFKNIKKIGFFNPRLNKVYVASLDILSKESIKEIEKDIIGYF